jgi:hypothetical protein|tara:strand:+ start:7106 stop:7633 length:528 start_codon:yes stop_codon:yes gene_type:complete
MSYRVRRPINKNPVVGLVDPVLVEIFSNERKLLDTSLNNIIKENQTLGGTMGCFRFNGEILSVTSLRLNLGSIIKDIHPDLVGSAQRYALRCEKLTADVKKLRHALSTVIGKCSHPQDVRDVLPDVIGNKIPELQGIDRLKPEGHVLRDKPALLKQFNECMEIALVYQANQLIYS